MTLSELEKALDSGLLQVQDRNLQWHKCRRNGQTHTWKRDPNRFQIPIKFGFKFTAQLTDKMLGQHCFRIAHGADKDFKLELV